MDDRENLFYRPDLRPDRDYHSDGAILDQPTITPTTETETPPVTIIDRMELLKANIEEIKEVSRYLPGELSAIMDGPLTKLIEQIDIMHTIETEEEELPEYTLYDPSLEDPLPGIPPTIDIVEDYMPLDVDLPSLLPNPTDVKIEILLTKSLADIARDTYKHDSIDLKEDYTKKLQTVMQKYLQEMVMIMAETGVGHIDDLTKPYDGSAVKIPNGSLQHLGDHIVRSQIAREQKTRLFKKTHNIDQTLMHMRSWHAAEKQRERYYESTYGDSENYLNTQSNSLLRESRAQYDKKYNQSLYDMYKYLNASVMIIDDTLNMSLKESQAKGTLLKNGVNIYATQETLEIAREQAATEKKKIDAAAASDKPAIDDTASVASTAKDSSIKDKAASAVNSATDNIDKQAENALKDFGKRLSNNRR
jgi:hypothetical protein